jgi:alcohol dehydrogenase
MLSGRWKPKKLITHEFKLEELMKAYDTFAAAAKEGAPEVVGRAP